MTIVDEIAIAFGLDTKKIPKQMAEMSNKLSSGISSIAKNLAGPLAAVFSFAAAGQMFREISTEADALGKAADRLGVSIEDLDAWGQAAKLSGGSAEALSSTVEALSRGLTELALTGSTGAKPFLEQLGVSATDSKGKIRDAFEVLEEMADKIEGMDKNKSLGILQGIGIDNGTINLIQSGKKSIQELIKEQKEIGVYNLKTAETMKRYNDAMDNFSRTAKMSLVPIMTFLADKFAKGAKLAADGIKYLRDHAVAITPVLAGLAVVLLAKAAPALSALTLNFLRLSAAFLTSPIGLVTMALLALGLAIEDMIVWANGGESALGDMWTSIFGSAEEALSIFESVKEVFEYVCDALIAAVKKIVPILIQMLGSIAMFIGVLAASVIILFQKIYGAITSLPEALRELREAIFGTSGAINTALSAASGHFDRFRDKVLGVIGKVKGAWEGFKGIFGGLNKTINIGTQGAALATRNGGNVDNSRQIDQTMTQNIEIKMNSADPNAVGQAVAGQTQTTFKNLSLAANGGQVGL